MSRCEVKGQIKIKIKTYGQSRTLYLQMCNHLSFQSYAHIFSHAVMQYTPSDIDSQTEIVVLISTSILTGHCLQEMVNIFLFFSFSFSLPSDHSLTVHNVQRVMEGVRGMQLSLVGLYLSVPETIRDKIDECSSDEEKVSSLAKYVVTILPNVTWEDIAAVLYCQDEKRAVERAKSYLHTVDIPGESCTLCERCKALLCYCISPLFCS